MLPYVGTIAPSPDQPEADRLNNHFWSVMRAPACCAADRFMKVAALAKALNEGELHDAEKVAGIAVQMLRDAVEAAERGERAALAVASY